MTSGFSPRNPDNPQCMAKSNKRTDRFDPERPYRLVLGGGGAKGVYHIGAWRALRELGVPVNAYVGNSIGAIIAAFLAQGLEKELEEIGATIKLETIVDVGPETEGLPDGSEMVSRFRKVSRQHAPGRGPGHHAPAGHSGRAHRREGRPRPGFRPWGHHRERHGHVPGRNFPGRYAAGEPGRLPDGQFRGAGFTLPKIQGKTYVDGGVYDNVPHEMARRQGISPDHRGGRIRGGHQYQARRGRFGDRVHQEFHPDGRHAGLRPELPWTASPYWATWTR
ncbi:MAG: patatin-like phospholipase family protein [Desulfomicrobium escambiense]|nr:patatin-like phospholipase family protein [Desulfomicrobium escambiense]